VCATMKTPIRLSTNAMEAVKHCVRSLFSTRSQPENNAKKTVRRTTSRNLILVFALNEFSCVRFDPVAYSVRFAEVRELRDRGPVELSGFKRRSTIIIVQLSENDEVHEGYGFQ